MAGNNRAVSHLFAVLDATGDLMRRKLLHALFYLSTQGRMKERCLILWAARREDLSDTGFRVEARGALAAAGFQDNELVGGLQTNAQWAHIVKNRCRPNSIGDGLAG